MVKRSAWRMSRWLWWLCWFGGHDWIKQHHTQIDLFGNPDGVKVVTCFRCGAVSPEYKCEFELCVNEPESEAFSRIKEVGIAKYTEERMAEGLAMYPDCESKES